MSRTTYLERLMELTEEALYEADLEATSSSRRRPDPVLRKLSEIKQVIDAAQVNIKAGKLEEAIKQIQKAHNSLTDLIKLAPGAPTWLDSAIDAILSLDEALEFLRMRETKDAQDSLKRALTSIKEAENQRKRSPGEIIRPVIKRSFR